VGVPVGAGEVWMWGGDACVAPPGGGRHLWEQDEGDASVPSPHIVHPRPYRYEASSQAYQ